MNVKAETKEDVSIFEINGRLDSAHSKSLDQQLMEVIKSGSKKILLDFQSLEYISSSGIRVLVHCHKEIEKKGGTLFLSRVPKPIENVLYITGFSPYFKVFETMEEAFKHFKHL